MTNDFFSTMSIIVADLLYCPVFGLWRKMKSRFFVEGQFIFLGSLRMSNREDA